MLAHWNLGRFGRDLYRPVRIASAHWMKHVARVCKYMHGRGARIWGLGGRKHVARDVPGAGAHARLFPTFQKAKRKLVNVFVGGSVEMRAGDRGWKCVYATCSPQAESRTA